MELHLLRGSAQVAHPVQDPKMDIVTRSVIPEPVRKMAAVRESRSAGCRDSAVALSGTMKRRKRGIS